jgi:hypothetical protein
MNLEFFYSLTTEQQLFVIRKNGVAIGERQTSRHNLFLHQIQSFYVEVGYEKSSGQLWRISPFDHPILLEPYLSQIDLADLIN